jgi:hypothetical protein
MYDVQNLANVGVYPDYEELDCKSAYSRMNRSITIEVTR